MHVIFVLEHEMPTDRNLSVVCCPFSWVKGAIPPELGELTELKELNLSFNHLVGR